MSVPEPVAMNPRAGLRYARCAVDVVELAAFRGRAAGLAATASERGCPLPRFGRLAVAARAVALAVRPERWLILGDASDPGASHAGWASACGESAAAIDLSSALAAFRLSGPAADEALARACRVDLDPVAFDVGRAVATIVAQLPVTLARLPGAWLLLTPSSTARHFIEWLETAAAPHGVAADSPCSLSNLSGVSRP